MSRRMDFSVDLDSIRLVKFEINGYSHFQRPQTKTKGIFYNCFESAT
jgi:hypothetical protein